MSRFDGLIARITERLRVDPELHLEVSQELRSHLEDSAGEYRSAGCAEQEAAKEAITHLGQEEELADQLWKGNRRRLKLRAILRHIAQVTLVPAALLIVVLFLPAGMWQFQYTIRQLDGKPAFMVMTVLTLPVELVRGEFPLLSAQQPSPSLASLTDEERWMYEGDPQATTSLQRARSRVERWPDNPLFYGQYASRVMEQVGADTALPQQELLAILNHGETIDPDNAHYNMLKAQYWFKASSEMEKETGPTYLFTHPTAGEVTEATDRVSINDMAMFKKGIAAFRRGVRKAHATERATELGRFRLGLLGQPRSYQQYLNRETQAWSSVPAMGFYRRVCKYVSAYAIVLTEQGRSDEALQLLDELEVMAAAMGADSSWLIELLVATSITRQALVYRQAIYRSLGRTAEAKELQQRHDNHPSHYRNWLSPQEQEAKRHVLQRSGMLLATLANNNAYRYKPQPQRRAEYAVSDRTAVLVLTMGASILLLVRLLRLGWHQLRAKSSGYRPTLLFVGWSRLGWICLWSILVPVAVYAAYSMLPFGGRVYGLNMTGERVTLEYTMLGSFIYLLFSALSYNAICHRGRQLGLDVPLPIRWRDRVWLLVVGAVLGTCVLIYLILWEVWIDDTTEIWNGPPALRNYGYILAGVVIYFIWIWRLRDIATAKGVSAKAKYCAHILLRFIGCLSVGLFLSVSTIYLFIGWPRHEEDWIVYLVFGAATAVLPWIVYELQHMPQHATTDVRFLRLLNRSMIPVLAGAVIVIGLLGGGVLRWTERAAVGGAEPVFLNELDHSPAGQLRDDYRKQHAIMLRSLGGLSDSSG